MNSSPHKPLKKVHSRSVNGTVMYQRLRNGTLDVNLETGKVYGMQGEEFTIEVSYDGYCRVHLSLPNKRCKPDGQGRRRLRQRAMVHRIVMMKKKAVEAMEEIDGVMNWRGFVKELPFGIDVDHIDKNTENNRAINLCLKTERANQNGWAQTPEETAAIKAYYADIDF